MQTKKIGILPNFDKDKDLEITNLVIKLFEGKCSVIVPVENLPGTIFQSEDELVKNADIIIVLGGDGTMLRAARISAPFKKPLLGINLGNLGFITEIEKGELSSFVDRLVLGDYEVEERMMLEAEVKHGGEVVASFIGLNDGVITTVSRIINIAQYVNDKLVCRYRADGVVVATPTGSTAYSLSAGGPIAAPDMNVFIISPICPHSMHVRPVIAGEDSLVRMVVERVGRSNAYLTIDGQAEYELFEGDEVIFKKAQHSTRLIKLTGIGFYQILRLKLTGRD